LLAASVPRTWSPVALWTESAVPDTFVGMSASSSGAAGLAAAWDGCGDARPDGAGEPDGDPDGDPDASAPALATGAAVAPASPSARRIAASTAEPAWRRSGWLTAPELARYASSEPRRNWMALAPDVSPAIAYPVSPMPSIAVTALPAASEACSDRAMASVAWSPKHVTLA